MGHLDTGRGAEDPVSTESKKMEAVEQKASRMQHQSRVEGQEARCRVMGSSQYWKAQEIGD